MLPSPLAAADRGEDVGEHRLVPAWGQASIGARASARNGVRTPFGILYCVRPTAATVSPESP